MQGLSSDEQDLTLMILDVFDELFDGVEPHIRERQDPEGLVVDRTQLLQLFPDISSCF